MSKPIALSGYFKRGSTWLLRVRRKDENGDPVDITGLTTRAMFREGGVDEPVVITLDETSGIAVSIDPTNGIIDLEITATQSALFSPGAKVFFDIEQVNDVTGHVWQSQTYRFSVVQEVTRD
jgi:hypothetical protein